MSGLEVSLCIKLYWLVGYYYTGLSCNVDVIDTETKTRVNSAELLKRTWAALKSYEW